MQHVTFWKRRRPVHVEAFVLKKVLSEEQRTSCACILDRWKFSNISAPPHLLMIRPDESADTVVEGDEDDASEGSVQKLDKRTKGSSGRTERFGQAQSRPSSSSRHARTRLLHFLARKRGIFTRCINSARAPFIAFVPRKTQMSLHMPTLRQQRSEPGF